jgi:hypothetical protein
MQERFLMTGKREAGTQLIDSDGAFLIFEKWYSEGKTVSCSGTLFGWGMQINGKVLSVSRSEIAFGLSEKATIVLRLDTDGLLFLYGEPKDAPIEIPEEAKNLSALVVTLPLRLTVETFVAARAGTVEDVPRRDALFFIELPR